MDSRKTGLIIQQLRKEKSLTQLELANQLGLSDKTVSKWERGLGCPDISSLNDLSRILEVDLTKLLMGSLMPNPKNNGQMKAVDFYVCKNCNNILFGLNDAEIHCCGRSLEAATCNKSDENHNLKVSIVEDDYYVEMNHPMTKEHYINFVAYVLDGGITLYKLYPEQCIGLRIPRYKKMDFYVYCNQHGLFRYNSLETMT